MDSTAQALEYLTDSTGFEGWMQYMEEELRRLNPQDEVPSIRVNHVELGMTFHLISGRIAVRGADGSFLVTEEELRPLRQVEGMILPVSA
ncbi:MAG TPA: hypothetical protein VGC56_06755 [Allosphingosinicella sp.]